MDKILIEPHYLGSLEYFTVLIRANTIIWEVQDHFEKQTFRNRCYFVTVRGLHPLSVPVRYTNRTPFREVRIDYNQTWVREHWGAFYSAYGKAPFFEFFAEEFRRVWDKKPAFLLDLNLDMMTLCLKMLQIDRPVSFTEKYNLTTESDILDLRNKILPKIPFKERKLYLPFQYIQIFGNKFVPNPSIVDLLLCEGSRAVEVLKNSGYSMDEHL